MRVPYAPHELLGAIELALKASAGVSGSIVGTVFETSAVLKIPTSRQHFWSPELQVGIDPDGVSGSTVTGIFGPRPAVWSMFVAMYACIGFFAMVGVVFATSEVMLDRPARTAWTVPAMLVVGAAVYAVARTGRSLGHDQMIELRTFLESTITNCTGA